MQLFYVFKGTQSCGLMPFFNSSVSSYLTQTLRPKLLTQTSDPILTLVLVKNAKQPNVIGRRKECLLPVSQLSGGSFSPKLICCRVSLMKFKMLDRLWYQAKHCRNTLTKPDLLESLI
eukprot:GFUD01051733.1.p1 GENE.GFUD01051733.1~~GFUD01051733.1.p1  ORF type:complete len:118 (+),score=12.73 GFUD01051733.1:160-513(+)